MHGMTLPVHPTLIDPATGEPLEALGVVGGRPVWPVIGGAEDGDEPEPDGDDDQDSPEEPDDKPDDDGKKKPEPEPFDEDRARAKITKANSENRGLRKRLTELEAAAAELKKLKDADKTESERLTERAASAEERAATAEQKLLRLEVAIDKGLTPAQARRLVGATKEELEEDADDLLASFTSAKDTKAKAGVPGRPKEKLPRGGGDPDEPIEETDPKKLAAAIPR